MAERFSTLGETVERMEQAVLGEIERRDFARRALTLRYPDAQQNGMQPDQLLTVRRAEDQGPDLWRTYNVIQENLLAGGLRRQAASGRTTRTRRLSSIREDLRINSGLWDLATQQLAS